MRESEKAKKEKKLEAARINREHLLKIREQDLKKLEKEVKHRLQKIAEEKDERVRRVQEEQFVRDLEHMREKNDKTGETYTRAKVRGLW